MCVSLVWKLTEINLGLESVKTLPRYNVEEPAIYSKGTGGDSERHEHLMFQDFC